MVRIEEAKEILEVLDKRLRETSKVFHHSTHLVEYKVEEKGVTYDLRDMLLMTAITGNNVLLTGKTGGGKTTIAKMAMEALFGDEYGFLPMDVTFSENKLRDLTFGAIKEGKDLSEAVKGTKLINAPGVIIDEYNRAPPDIVNILQGYLQNGTLVFEGGREITPGIEDGKDIYQWKIVTVNEGEKYYGARKIDKASRNRLATEINLDLFEPGESDKRKIIAEKRIKSNGNRESCLNYVLELHRQVEEVEINPMATEFFLYFSRMNQCVKSPEKTKLSVNFSLEYCKGCHLKALDAEICSSVFAPPERTIIHWKDLSQAFALYRACKQECKPEVTVEDAAAAAPFVLYSKLDINDGWVAKKAKGSLWNAINFVVKICRDRQLRFWKAHEDILKRGDPTEEDMEKITKYVSERDPWAMDLREVG